jgi:hypothetical protein
MSTLSRNEEVARLYEEGASETELGRRYHCHHGVIRGWLEDLGVHIRTRSEAMTLVAERKMLENVPAGMARCACGLLMPAGAEQCDICAAGEHETERQAEEALFSSAAFLGNPRNIGRYDPAKVRCITGVIPRW